MNTIQLVIGDEVHEITIKEYQGQRVVTFKDVDTLHKRPNGTAGNNFQNNKKRFLEGEDYFILKPNQKDEIRPLQIPNRGLTILTESGYLMLVKSFTDDLAWQVQRQLVKTYFKAIDHFTPKQVEVVPAQPQIPTTIEDILLMAIGNMKEMKSVIAQQSDQITKLRLVVDNEVHITDQQCALIQEAVKKRVGQLKRQGYDAHFQSIFSALKVFFTVPKYNKIQRGDFEKALDFIKGWFPKKNELTERDFKDFTSEIE